LFGYFGHDSYKLLEKNTSAIFRSCDVIFEEGTTHYARQPTPISFIDENDPFSYRPNNQIQVIEEDRNHKIERKLKQEPVRPLLQVIASRPSTISNLHKDEHKKNTDLTTQTTNIPLTELPVNEYGSQHDDGEASLTTRRSQCIPKPLNRLMESKEYLSRPYIFSVDTDTWIPRTFNKAMRKPELWWELMVKEFKMLKEQGVCKGTPPFPPLNGMTTLRSYLSLFTSDT